MRAVLQRVTSASVSTGYYSCSIGNGLVVFLGFRYDDREDDISYIVDKVVNLRIFDDAAGHMNSSAIEENAQLMIVSQFTLYADIRKGRRPSYTGAARSDNALELYDQTVDLFRQTGLSIHTGIFREHMRVDLQNDGPVTIIIDSADRHRPRRSGLNPTGAI